MRPAKHHQGRKLKPNNNFRALVKKVDDMEVEKISLLAMGFTLKKLEFRISNLEFTPSTH